MRKIELPELEAATLATVLIANSESLGGVTPERLNNLDPELSPIGRGLLKYRMLLPAVGDVKAHAGADADAPAPGRGLRGGRRARLADRPGGGAAAGGAAGRAAVAARSPPTQANVRGGALANLTGIPAISVPVGSSEGLPIGLQLQAAWGRDELLLDAAEALERANGRRWVEALPPLRAAPSRLEA